ERLPPVIDPTRFLVQWQGEDLPEQGASGIASFDIFVAIDGGLFTEWQTHTTRTSAFYDGVEGHRYAFYSVATDYAGNRESAPPDPDANTTIRPPSGEIHGFVFHDLNSNR